MTYALLIACDGREADVSLSYPLRGPASMIGAEVLDTVNLRDGRTMFVDDLGHQKELPVNLKATKLYHGVCRPGTTHQIRGNVVIVWERDDTLLGDPLPQGA